MKKSFLDSNNSPIGRFFKGRKMIVFPLILIIILPVLMGWLGGQRNPSPVIPVIFWVLFGIVFGCIIILLYSNAKRKQEWIMFLAFITAYYYYLLKISFDIFSSGVGEPDTTGLAVVILFIPYFIVLLLSTIIVRYIVKKKTSFQE